MGNTQCLRSQLASRDNFHSLDVFQTGEPLRGKFGFLSDFRFVQFKIKKEKSIRGASSPSDSVGRVVTTQAGMGNSQRTSTNQDEIPEPQKTLRLAIEFY